MASEFIKLIQERKKSKLSPKMDGDMIKNLMVKMAKGENPFASEVMARRLEQELKKAGEIKTESVAKAVLLKTLGITELDGTMGDTALEELWEAFVQLEQASVLQEE